MTRAMSRNQRLSAMRGWLHDNVCRSEGCRGSGDNDHARRMHPYAKAYVDAADDAGRADALHLALCLPGCTSETHVRIAADKILPAAKDIA